jgi:hypothetical protein
VRTLAEQQNNPTTLMEANKFIPSHLTLLEEAIIDSNSISAEGDQVSSAVRVSSKPLLCAPEPSTPEASCPTTEKRDEDNQKRGCARGVLPGPTLVYCERHKS